MSSASHYAVFVQLTALPAWLALPRQQRRTVIADHVEPALSLHPSCTVRWFDAEAMTATCSDVLLVETHDLRQWNHLWERLRDSPLFAHPYFRLDGLIVGTEDGYQDYEATLDQAHDR